MLEHLKVNCVEYYQPSQNLLADERMVKNKWWFTCKQYIMNKPDGDSNCGCYVTHQMATLTTSKFIEGKKVVLSVRMASLMM